MLMEKTEELGKMLFHIARLHATRADQCMDKIDLFRGQGMLLKFIDRHDGLTHSEIAAKLNISPAAVTKVIKRLEEQKYLMRKKDPVDERISRVYIQEEGKKVADEICSNFEQLGRSTFQGFTDEELDQLQSYFLRIQANLQNNFSEPILVERRHPGFHRNL